MSNDKTAELREKAFTIGDRVSRTRRVDGELIVVPLEDAEAAIEAAERRERETCAMLAEIHGAVASGAMIAGLIRDRTEEQP